MNYTNPNPMDFVFSGNALNLTKHFFLFLIINLLFTPLLFAGTTAFDLAPDVTCPDPLVDLSCFDTLPAPATDIYEFLDLPGTDVTDDCSDIWKIMVTSVDDVDPSTFSFCPGDGPFVVTRTYLLTNDCEFGQTSICQQTFTWLANTAELQISCPDSIVGLTCGDLLPPAANTVAEFQSLTGGVVLNNCASLDQLTITSTDDLNPGLFTPCDTPFVVTRTYIITDACANIADTCTQIIAWAADTEAPIINCPASVTVACDASIDPSFLGMATATDNCEPGLPCEISSLGTSNDNLFCFGSGNLFQQTFVACENGYIEELILDISYVENAGTIEIGLSAGVQTLPQNNSSIYANDKGELTIGLASPFQVVANTMYTLTINVPNPVDVCLNQSADDYPDGSAWVNGFPLQADFAFAMSIETGGIAAPPVITFMDSLAIGNCPQEMIITRTWMATDVCGNVGECEQLITLIDTEAPEVTAPTSIIGLTCNDTLPAAANSIADFLLLPGADVVDNCAVENDFIISHSDDLVTDAFSFCASDAPFVITRTYVIGDACGNMANAVTQTFTWETDSSAPIVEAPSPVAGLTCNDELPAPATTISDFLNLTGSSAVDNCTAIEDLLIASSDDLNPNDFNFCTSDAPFIVTRTYVITDVCGNNSIGATQTFTWESDLEAPVITCPDPVINLTCMDNLPAAATTIEEYLLLPGTSISDICSTTFSISSTDDSDPENSIYCSIVGPNVITRTYIITDACGNAAAACPQTFTWLADATPPVALCQDITLELDANGMAAINPMDINNGSTDDCGGLNFSTDITSLDCSAIGTATLVNLTVTNVCQNESSCTASVTVVDLLPPSLICPGDITITLNSGECSTIFNYTIGAVDNCDSAPVVVMLDGLPSGATLEKNTTQAYSFMATDTYGNTSSCAWTVTVEEFPQQTTQLNCQSSQTVALDVYCQGEITPGMMLNGGPYGCLDDFEVNLFFDEELTMPVEGSPFVDGTHVGQTLYAAVYAESGNFCWGTVLIEDNLIPDLVCMSYEVACFESHTPGINVGFPLPDSANVFQTIAQAGSTEFTVANFDPCTDAAILTFTDDVAELDCAPGNPFSEIIMRHWIFTDGNGNSSDCMDTINVRRATLTDVLAPSDFNNLDQPMLLCSEKETASGNSCGAAIGWNAIDAGDFNFPVEIGHPSPANEYYACGAVKWWGTGFPQEGATCENISYVFEDLRINACSSGSSDGCYDVIRKWTLLEWCSGDFIEIDQYIKVGDNEGPEISNLEDVTISTEVWTCSGNYYIPDPLLTDNCSEVINDYNISSSAGEVAWLASLQKYIITDLPLGVHNYTISATDCCGNETQETYEINVQDLVPPVVVASLEHSVSLTSDGSGKVFAATFDDGSYDACGAVWLKVIREPDLLNTVSGSFADQNTSAADLLNGDDDLLKIGNQIYFDDFVKFACEDIGQTGLQVQLRVFDKDPGAGPVDPARMTAPNGDLFGHFNDGWSNIEVADYLPPNIIAPDDLTISCEFWYDANSLEDIDNSIFGQIVTEDQNGDGLLNILDRGPISITDRACPGDANYNPLDPFVEYTLDVGIDGIAEDNCGLTISINAVENLSCGQGTIIRIFTATDAFGYSATATQTITIADCDPFFINDTNCVNLDPFDGVHWPCEVFTTTCGAATEPLVTGEPLIFNDDQCALISVTHDDEDFPVVADACFKIKRIWTVTDWCNYDEFDTDVNDVYDPTDDGIIAGQWEYVQFINVNNTIAPEFSTCDDITICGYNLDCTGSASLTQSISDDCTPGELLLVDFKIDLNNDGVGDYLGSNQAVYPFPNPNGLPLLAVSYSDNGNGSFELTIGAIDYPVGVHSILWNAEDVCSNVNSCQYLFTIEDCQLPTPKAANGLAVGIMPNTQMVTLPAEWFDANSFDNCGLAQLLVNSPSAGPGQDVPPVSASPTVTFDCDDIGTNTVDLWAEDINGNWDYVSTYVLVQDNQNACLNPQGEVGILGVVESELAELMPEVTVMIDGNLSGLPDPEITGVSGAYGFPDLPVGQNYVVTPEKLNNLRWGLSTLDLVLISRHLTGLESLNSPYKLIAADVNNNGQVETFDLIDLQKVILFVYDEFPNGNTSYRFVDAAFSFPNENNPFESSFPENFTANNLSTTELVDFISVKVGDVNNSVPMNAPDFSKDRSVNEDLIFVTADKKVEAGEIYDVAFKAKDFDAILGYQFTMNINSSLEVLDVQAKSTDASFGLSLLEQGKLTASFGSTQAITLADDDDLFSLKIRAKKNGLLSEWLSIDQSGRFLSAEAYRENLDLMNAIIQFNEEEQDKPTGHTFSLEQNHPNPFQLETKIGFELIRGGKATLTVYDVSGRVVKIIQGDYSAGYNEISLERSDLGAQADSGVFYYELVAQENSAIKKMVALE